MSYGGANSNLCCLGDDIKYEGVHDDFHDDVFGGLFQKALNLRGLLGQSPKVAKVVSTQTCQPTWK